MGRSEVAGAAFMAEPISMVVGTGKSMIAWFELRRPTARAVDPCILEERKVISNFKLRGRTPQAAEEFRHS
jgi:hypothetical protein